MPVQENLAQSPSWQTFPVALPEPVSSIRLPLIVPWKVAELLVNSSFGPSGVCKANFPVPCRWFPLMTPVLGGRPNSTLSSDSKLTLHLSCVMVTSVSPLVVTVSLSPSTVHVTSISSSSVQTPAILTHSPVGVSVTPVTTKFCKLSCHWTRVVFPA